MKCCVCFASICTFSDENFIFLAGKEADITKLLEEWAQI